MSTCKIGLTHAESIEQRCHWT